MVVTDNNTPPPTKPLNNKKPLGVTNLKNNIPLVLGLGQLTCDAWNELFTTYCNSFGVLGFLDGTITSTSTTAQAWNCFDSLVKVWIYDTISTSHLQTILKKNVTTHNVWKSLKELFHDNKDARTMELQEELQSLELGNLTISEYLKKIKMVSDLLSNIDSLIDEKSLVTHAIIDLGKRYEQVAGIIRHMTKRPTLLEILSMLMLEESSDSRLNRRMLALKPVTTRLHLRLQSSWLLVQTPQNVITKKKFVKIFKKGIVDLGPSVVTFMLSKLGQIHKVILGP
ncbi:hypothetical protein CTI12_AA127550 [Artemisia annua]|uniref:Hybrid signal transduction histidine kinase M n=1 Tax=Artemisia annua TaxID=35608 RepID=A0A2U1PPN1_ARTAN|nr:hypothetical protein CTI12_AA127550 [Artemisia annua]